MMYDGGGDVTSKLLALATNEVIWRQQPKLLTFLSLTPFETGSKWAISKLLLQS
jgi:hypothetical protein